MSVVTWSPAAAARAIVCHIESSSWGILNALPDGG